MAPDLSEKLLGIDIGDSQDRNRQRDDDPEELEQFVFFETGGHRLALPVDDVRTLAEVPDEFTRVPRSPAAIEGMVDLRGEITAVIDPRVHFPDGDGAADGSSDERAAAAERSTFADEERLLVLDRPADQQAAALRADEVLGVETIPESAILDEAAVEDRTLTGEALAHPLVAALIERERTPEGASVVASTAAVDVAPEAGGAAAVTSAESTRSGADAIGSPFELEEAKAETATGSASSGKPKSTSAPPQEVVVEVTPLIDLDALLLASGQRE